MLDRVAVNGFRAARELVLEPRRICALVGEASSGKSTVLTAIWMLLESGAPVPNAGDIFHGAANGRIRIEASSGRRGFFLDARPPATLNLNREGAPPVVFLPANLRATTLVADASHPKAAKASTLLRPDGAVDGGAAAIAGVERLLDAKVRGLVVLIEEPELYLSPQSQRHLYRLLRALAARGNQVFYSTHASSFLSVTHLDELALVRHRSGAGTVLCQPAALPSDDSFRALAEFDAERAEIFLSRAVLLVEGMTEKLVFPFVFDALGYEPDREAILVLETGGKANMPLFARICNECGIPFVVVHDRDAPRGRQPNESERITNAAILEVAGRQRVVQLVPDFESAIGLPPSRRGRKPERAVRRFRGGKPVPKELTQAVEKVVAAARGRGTRVNGRGGSPPRRQRADGDAQSGAPRAGRAQRSRARRRRAP
jgi:predicted ATPase